MPSKSLILVLLTGTPKNYKNNEAISASNKELESIGHNDVESLKKQNFSGTFNKDSYVCETLIYLNRKTGENNFKKVISKLIKYNRITKKLDNLAINFAGHGALDVIGGEEDNPKIDHGPKTLANTTYQAIISVFNAKTVPLPQNIHFYFRNCNSAYPNPNPQRFQEGLDKNNLSQLYAGTSLAGLFTLRLRQIIKKDDKISFPFYVSGFVGYLEDTKDSNPTVSNRSKKKGKSFLASDCRLTFYCQNPDSELKVMLPLNDKMIKLLEKDKPNETKDDDEVSNFSIDEACLTNLQELERDVHDMTINEASQNLSKKHKATEEVIRVITESLEKDPEKTLNTIDLVKFITFLTLCYVVTSQKKVRNTDTGLRSLDRKEKSDISELGEELEDFLITTPSENKEQKNKSKNKPPSTSPKIVAAESKKNKSNPRCVIL